MTTTPQQLDTTELEQRVKSMYQEVALEPEREFHFETGRALAERLGYPAEELDRNPAHSDRVIRRCRLLPRPSSDRAG